MQKKKLQKGHLHSEDKQPVCFKYGIMRMDGGGNSYLQTNLRMTFILLMISSYPQNTVEPPIRNYKNVKPTAVDVQLWEVVPFKSLYRIGLKSFLTWLMQRLTPCLNVLFM